MTAATALTVTVIPALTVLLAAPRYPQFGHWPAYTANVLMIGAVSLLVGVVLSPTVSWAPPLTLSLVTIAAQQFWGEQIEVWWPFADPHTTAHDRWVVSLVLLLTAVLVQAATRGATLGSSRRAVSED